MKILQISTYPIVRPLHGGQIRVKKIKEELIKLGHQVKSISFSEYSHMFFDDELDYVVSSATLSKVIKTRFSTDLATAFESKDSKAMRAFITKHILAFNPDCIFLEQPWLWPLIKSMLEDGTLKNIKVVYSSQNIEYLTKLSLFESNDITDTCGVVDSIKEIESDLCSSADIVIACTETDLQEFVTLGAKRTVLCPNGVTPFAGSKESIDQIKHLIGERKFALIVGSAYPPNAQGFWSMLGNSMAWLAPDEMIIAVGGCSMILEDFAPKESMIYDFVNSDKIKKLGFVECDELSALISNASVVILPITSGGGSNLKTAEAIISGKPVVATTMACRGFGDVKKYSNFLVCDDKDKFIGGIKHYLEFDIEDISDDEKSLRNSVLWDNALAELSVF